jgi:hypothetical protein
MQATSEPEGLPVVTGRHQVGRVSFNWVDPSRVRIYSSDPQDRRALVVWAWYPAASGPDAERAAYLPEPWVPAGQFLGLDAAGLVSHAVEDAAVAGKQSCYPVLVLSHSGFPAAAVCRHRRGAGQSWLCRCGREPQLRDSGDGVRRQSSSPHESGRGLGVLGPQTGAVSGAVPPEGRSATTGRRSVSGQASQGGSRALAQGDDISVVIRAGTLQRLLVRLYAAIVDQPGECLDRHGLRNSCRRRPSRLALQAA